MEKRIGWIDTIKGVTIFLMILGHVIQYANGTDYLQTGKFAENSVFLAIYSFHMPIFMFLSGFCFYRTCQTKDTWTIISDKVKLFIIPFVGGSMITYIILSLINRQDILSTWNLINFFRGNYNFLWFLWVILYCSVIMLVVNRLFKDNIFICFIIIFSGFFYPDFFNFINFKMMFPFFALGYMCNKYQIIEYFENSKVIHAIVSIIFIVFYILLWNEEFIMYWNFAGIQNIRYVLARWLINLSGMWVIISLFYELEKRKTRNKIQNLGRHTLGVYLISMYICYYIVPNYSIYSVNIMVVILYNILLSIAITMVSYYITLCGNIAKGRLCEFCRKKEK